MKTIKNNPAKTCRPAIELFKTETIMLVKPADYDWKNHHPITLEEYEKVTPYLNRVQGMGHNVYGMYWYHPILINLWDKYKIPYSEFKVEVRCQHYKDQTETNKQKFRLFNDDKIHEAEYVSFMTVIDTEAEAYDIRDIMWI